MKWMHPRFPVGLSKQHGYKHRRREEQEPFQLILEELPRPRGCPKLAGDHGNEQQQHWRQNQNRTSSSAAFCSNRYVAPDPWHQITVACHSPVRVEYARSFYATAVNRPVVAAPATASDAARSLAPIRSDIVQRPWS
ncbi:hypothetical protein pipiens_016758 [Culex pipiens pipiens]|uniref:Uncharacterized protein n=1 Tax=Culex pipiens pipiens TaxID=38569 RepID=A0ABD1CJU6_CULPP